MNENDAHKKMASAGKFMIYAGAVISAFSMIFGFLLSLDQPVDSPLFFGVIPGMMLAMLGYLKRTSVAAVESAKASITSAREDSLGA